MWTDRQVVTGKERDQLGRRLPLRSTQEVMVARMGRMESGGVGELQESNQQNLATDWLSG